MTVHFLDLKIRSDKEKLTFLRDAYPAEESNISELIKEFQDLRHEHDALMADIKELKEWHNIHIIYRIKAIFAHLKHLLSQSRILFTACGVASI